MMSRVECVIIQTRSPVGCPQLVYQGIMMSRVECVIIQTRSPVG